MKATNFSRIGPYEIVAPLGAGGMGEVYRAWDPRLHREVALKLLPHGVASDAQTRRRFQEEARAASALSHPNILAVYDVGLDESSSFIVSELIAGKRLRDEIERGPLPLKRLLDLAVQMAAGLSAAHDAGIVHRDLKPENVMVTPDGRVKIVDFGLARAYAASPGPLPEAAGGQTLTATIAGTPRYMSPEQARGGQVDFRSDQFSLGLMLYEMVTGAHPFCRETAAQTMSAIIEEEVRPIEDANPKVPLFLRWIVDRCLAKDPVDRYASTSDLAKDLALVRNRLAEMAADEGRQQSPPGPRRGRRALVIGAALVLLAVAAAAVVPPPAGRPAGFFTPLVTDASFQGAPAWSPDGRTIAYVSQVDGILQVFTRSLASSQRAQVTHSRFDCNDPFWSPDGTRIFYHSLAGYSEGLWSVSAAGGSPQNVLENASRAALSADGGTLVFLREDETNQPGMSRELWVASSSGTDPRRYMEPPFDQRTFVDGTLRFAPDGSKLLLWGWGWSDQAFGVPTPTFWILPWPSGRPYEVLSSLSESARASVSFDWLPDSRRIVAALWDPHKAGTYLSVVDTKRASAETLTMTPGSESRPSVTRDGTRVAFTSEAVDFDLVEIPLDGTPARTILKTSRNELDPAFGPAGAQYAYVTDRSGTLEIWLRSRQGQWEQPVVGAHQFEDSTYALGAPSISPDGTLIAYQRYGRLNGYRVWYSSLAAAGPPVQLAPGALYQDAPTWSPDGKWIAFIERRGEDLRLTKLRVGSDAPPEHIAGDVVLFSRVEWSPDGRWILCDTFDGLATISPDGSQRRVISNERWIAYAWSADSAHVYGLREADTPRHFMLVALDIDTLEERIVNPDLGIIPPAHQAIRGLSRIGHEAFATSIARAESDIFVLEEFQRAGTWLGWLRTTGGQTGVRPGTERGQTLR